MKKRTLFIVALVVLLLGSTVGAYAYWDNLQQTQAETITIGAGTTLTVTADAVAPAGKVLVPAGTVIKADDVEEIVLTYNVKLDKAAVANLNLAVVASNIKINDSTTNASLVTVDVSLASATVNNSDVVVTVTVTLSEPGTQAIYDAIINQDITFDLTFTATIA